LRPTAARRSIAPENDPLIQRMLRDEESPQNYRAGFDTGVKFGTAAYLNNPMMEDMALELTLLRAMVAAMTIEAERHEKLIEHYRIILTGK
jgi:hypothetical protein